MKVVWRSSQGVGIAIALAGLLFVTTLLVVEPIPASAYELATGQAQRASVGGSRLVYYDAANDTTLAVFGFWDHDPAGDAFAFRGDVSEELRSGRKLIEPEGGAPVTRTRDDMTLVERAGAYASSNETRAAGEYRISPPMVLRAYWPPVFAYAGAITIAFVGVALALRARWGALGVPASMIVALQIGRGSELILMLAAVVAVIVGLPAALVFMRTRSRLAVALACAVATFVAIACIMNAFMPVGGGAI